MNIKRQKGNVLTVLVPIEGFYYSFDWDVSKEENSFQVNKQTLHSRLGH